MSFKSDPSGSITLVLITVFIYAGSVTMLSAMGVHLLLTIIFITLIVGYFMFWILSLIDFLESDNYKPSIVKSIEVNHFETMKRKNWVYTYWAFDLHSTVIKPNYEAGNIPKEFYPLAKECLQQISKCPHIKMIMYTCSFPNEQKEYLDYFKENGIRFDFVNKNTDVKTEEGGYGYYEDKPYFNVLFEDKAGFDAENDWEYVKELLIEKQYWNE